MSEQLKPRPDLIGQTGSVTRRIKVVDARESESVVDIRVQDSMGNEYWTELDGDISLD